MNDDGRVPDGTGLSQAEPARAVSSVPASIPRAGDKFTIAYPFVRGTFLDVFGTFDEGEPVDKATWRPGIEFRQFCTEDTEAFCDAEGRAQFSVVAVFKPGHYPARVFFTRKFIDPDGKEFGKHKLHIATLDKFRRLVSGYQHPYGIGDGPPPLHRPYRLTRETFEQMLAAARSDSDGSPKGGDASGSVHDSAGPKDIAQGQSV
jgi:hypothetical protein